MQMISEQLRKVRTSQNNLFYFDHKELPMKIGRREAWLWYRNEPIKLGWNEHPN